MRTAIISLMAAALCVATFPASSAPRRVVIVSDAAYPPYSYEERGAAKGVYPAILRRIAAEMPDYGIEILPLPWKRALSMVEEGGAFGIIPPYRREALRPWMGYSAPILEERIVVYCASAVAARLAGLTYPQDYGGITFGNLSGSRAGGEALHAMAERGQVVIVDARSTEINIRKLLSGRVQCVVDELRSFESTWTRVFLPDPQMKRTFARTADVSVEQTYLGVGSDAGYPFRDDFLRRFNDVLSDMKKSGEFDNLVHRYLVEEAVPDE